jgi:hypothetical protein
VTKQIIPLETRISYLKSRNKYFERHVIEQPLFLPEYEVSKEILEIIDTVDKTDEGKLVDIVDSYNKITSIDHYNGSGWFDFQIQLKGYFHHYGYSVEFEKDTAKMRIEKS